MASKEFKRFQTNTELLRAIGEAIQKAHEAGLSAEDVKAALERFTSILEEE